VSVAAPPSTTQQPNNSTTVLSPEPVPVDIEVADQLLETPHLNPLPQGERKECEPVTTSAPETVIVEISDAAIVPEEAIKAPESESKPEPVVAEEQEAEAENIEKIQV
jgi:hypothetical protein